MRDLLYVALTLGFFALMWRWVRFCASLGRVAAAAGEMRR